MGTGNVALFHYPWIGLQSENRCHKWQYFKNENSQVHFCACWLIW